MTRLPVPAPDPAAGVIDAGRSWINKTPGVCGGDACLRGTRVTVWGLVALRRFGLSEAEIMREVEGLAAEDLAAAWEYAAAHADEIDAAIRRNDEEA